MVPGGFKARDFAAAALALLLTVAGSPDAAGARSAPQDLPAAADVLADIRDARLDVKGARPVKGVKLDTGFADLYLADGYLFPTLTPAGHVVEVVFIGSGRLRLATQDPIEAAQLELFTGAPTLDETFREAVLLIGSDAASRALLDRATSPAPADVVSLARARYDAWSTGPVRGLLDVDAAAALDRLGEPLYSGHFGGFFLGEQLGDLLISLQPESPEQLVLGRFQPLELEARDRRRAERRISRLRRRGRFLGLKLQDLGTFDVWVSMPLRQNGEASPGFSTFEPTHYHLTADLDTGDDSFRATARLDLEPQVAQARSVGLVLPTDLPVAGIYDAAGEPLTYHRDKERIRVFLPRPTSEAIQLRVDYGGKGLLSHAKAWLPIDNLGWYPRTGTVDRATYELELTWPRRYELVASGAVVAEENRGRRRWQHRRLDVPGLGASFAVGQFETREIHVGDTRVSLAVDNSLGGGSKATVDDIGATVAGSLAYFEAAFGDYPLDHLSVVTLPSGLSQSLPGYIQLSNLAMEDDWLYTLLLGLEDRRTVIAHEVAHQWWGNQIGWKTYRDQWISEAMANYSALLWARQGAPKDLVLGFGPTAGWEAALGVTLADGRPVESVGPMVLGERLSSSLADAYSDIVYKKGAVVIDMLAGFWGEERFAEILGRLTRAAAGHTISTENFFSLVEQISGHELGAFADRFVYGTGLPEIYYAYRFEALDNGKHRIHLEAEQEVPYRFRYRVVETSRGLDVARERVDQVAELAAPMAVPFQVELEVPDAGPGEVHTLAGRLAFEERKTTVALELEHRPKSVQLDPYGQVFGRFYSRTAQPKRIDFRRAYDVAAGGDVEHARRLFLAVLKTGTPVPDDAPRGRRDELQEQDRFTDWRSRLQLARLDLRAGRLDDAADHLEIADKLKPRRSRSAKYAHQRFEAHLALLRGDGEGAYRDLRRLVRRQGQRASVETWLLLAVAAEAAGQGDAAREALGKVEDSGADISVLEARLNS